MSAPTQSPGAATENNATPAELAREGTRLLTSIISRLARLGAIYLRGQHERYRPASATSMTATCVRALPALAANPLRLWLQAVDTVSELTLANIEATREALSPTTETPRASDRRFRDPLWSRNPWLAMVRRSYETIARSAEELVAGIPALDEREREKLAFYTRQFNAAAAPVNVPWLNPEVTRAAIDTHGLSLLRGFDNYLADLERGRGRLRISMTDPEPFELGVNVAASAGKVVYQNEIMQLIQYAPLTETVYERPLLIVPPWINKFYILDLRPENSFIRYAVSQGHTVFVISWVNPDEHQAGLEFADYMRSGILAALDAVGEATGAADVNAIGYCIGGTLLATTLGWMAAHDDRRIASATYFTSLVDFADPGDIGVFIDAEQLDRMDELMAEKGYLDGAAMATAFNMLRPEELIWSYVRNNYLLGRAPRPFDLLYWNSDCTRMPRAMHNFYLRNMYQHNRLVRGELAIDGERVDLRRITAPTYIVSTKEDHIAPWRTTYTAATLYRGPVRFVLGESGHIAGIVNPPGGKYGHYVNERVVPDAEAWLAQAQRVAGSWWDDWREWVRPFGGMRVPARIPGDGGLAPIEDAPGSYVRVRA